MTCRHQLFGDKKPYLTSTDFYSGWPWLESGGDPVKVFFKKTKLFISFLTMGSFNLNIRINTVVQSQSK